LYHEPEKIPEPDASTQHRFDEGHIIGELAKKRFPSGISIAEDDFKENIRKTKELLKGKKLRDLLLEPVPTCVCLCHAFHPSTEHWIFRHVSLIVANHVFNRFHIITNTVPIRPQELFHPIFQTSIPPLYETNIPDVGLMSSILF